MAWNGSLNETAAGWQEIWERENVYPSWDSEPDRVTDKATNFEMIWAHCSSRVVVLDLPELASRDSLRFMPATACRSRWSLICRPLTILSPKTAGTRSENSIRKARVQVDR